MVQVEEEEDFEVEHRKCSTMQTGQTADLPFALPSLLLEALVYGLGDRGLHQVDVPHDQRRKRVPQVLMEASVLQVVVQSQVVVEYLEQRETVPRVWRLLRQHSVHVHREQGPEYFRMLHQKVAEPRKGLRAE